MTIKRRKNAILQTRQKKKIAKTFFLHSSREKFPTHHQHFFVPCLRKESHKIFYDHKKILFDVFSKLISLVHSEKGNCIFYFTQKKLFCLIDKLKVVQTFWRYQILKLLFLFVAILNSAITGTKYPEQTFRWK